MGIFEYLREAMHRAAYEIIEDEELCKGHIPSFLGFGQCARGLPQ
jgi:hypothetical protein